MKKKVFKKKKYKFNYMIKTDGVACSILFIKTDSDNNPIKITKKLINEMDKIKDKILLNIIKGPNLSRKRKEKERRNT